MKKLLSILLASLMLIPAAVSCAPTADQIDPAITLASSDAATKAEWLDSRLDGEIPDRVIMGIGSNETYGVDMTNFDDIGYIARAIDGDILLFGKTEDGLDRACREYAKAVDAGAQNSLDTVYGEGEWIEELTIAGTDISEFTVIYTHEEKSGVPSSMTVTRGNAKYAAGEIVRLIEQATGVTLPMQAEDVSGPMIKFGYLPDDGSYGDHAFAYEVKDGNLYINGVARSNGCAMGVYFFLENECGWDSLVFGDSELQEAERIDVENGTALAIDPAFDFMRIRSVTYNGKMMDYETDRRDMYYMGIYGTPGHAMAKWSELDESVVTCYNNEDVYATVSENVAKALAGYVSAGQELGIDVTTIGMGGNDTNEHCMCRVCMQTYREEGQAHIGSVMRFANRLEEEMDSLGYDNVKYAYLAYAGLNKPPKKTMPNYDIQITYCSDGACYFHPADGSQCSGITTNSGLLGLDTTEKIECKLYAEWLEEWCSIASYVYLYSYLLMNFFHEYTAIEHLWQDYQWYKEIGLDGVGPEADYMGLGLGRFRFRVMYMGHWYHDVTQAEWDIMVDEIMAEEYGDGWDFVKDFIGIWQQTEEGLGCLACWDFASLFKDDQYNPYMYAARSEEMYQLLEKARKLANNELQEKNVERLLMLVIGNQCYTTYFDVYERNDTERMAVLEERWSLIWTYARHSGIEQRFLIDGNCMWSQERVLNKNLHDEAWNCWNQQKNYYVEGEPTRPAPEEYAR